MAGEGVAEAFFDIDVDLPRRVTERQSRENKLPDVVLQIHYKRTDIDSHINKALTSVLQERALGLFNSPKSIPRSFSLFKT